MHLIGELNGERGVEGNLKGILLGNLRQEVRAGDH